MSSVVTELSKTFCGSRAYTPPEVLRHKPYNPKKYDIWTTGIVLMVMLNKKFPYSDVTIRKLLVRMVAKRIDEMYEEYEESFAIRAYLFKFLTDCDHTDVCLLKARQL